MKLLALAATIATTQAAALAAGKECKAAATKADEKCAAAHKCGTATWKKSVKTTGDDGSTAAALATAPFVKTKSYCLPDAVCTAKTLALLLQLPTQLPLLSLLLPTQLPL